MTGEVTSSPSELFARFLGRLDRGESVDFETFCLEHPEQEDELRRLHADWDNLRDVFERLGFSASFPERIRESFGAGIDPEIELAESDRSQSDPSLPGMVVKKAGQARYALQDRLGHGGQGEVFAVWDENLRRPLAMKVVDPRSRNRPSSELDSRKLARILEEAQITAQLDHPGIVPVHELGLDPDDRVFFTMKLVKGEHLLAIFDKVSTGAEGWSTTRALGVLLRVCEAMAYAHSKNVIHRDLKPANVMVGRFGEVYVMDWGLARVLGRVDKKDIRLCPPAAAANTLTRDTMELLLNRRPAADSQLVTMDGDVVGTPAYMSPEQARGELDAMGPASDVYSLGAILYHLLTGAPPYTQPGGRQDNYAILGQLLRGPPGSLAARALNAPPPLVAICEHAMARESAKRYASMLAFAEDLRAYLEGRVVRVYEHGVAAELRRWVQRNRSLTAALVAVVLLVTAGLGTAAHLQGRRLRDARWSSYLANLPLAHVSAGSGDTADAHRRLADCPEEHRGFEWEHVALSADLASLVITGQGSPVTAIDVSPDGSLAVAASVDGAVKLWELARGTCAKTLVDRGARVNCAVFSPDGTRVYAGSSDQQVRAWNAVSGELAQGLQQSSDAVHCLTMDPAGRLAAACEDGSIVIWDAPVTNPVPRTLIDPDSHFVAVHSLAFAQEGKLVSATRQGIQLWDLETGRAQTISCDTGAMDASRDGCIALADLLASGLQLRFPLRDEPATTSMEPGFASGHARPITCLAFDAPGEFLASGSRDPQIRVWDVQAGGSIGSVLSGHEGRITALAFGPGGGTLFSGSDDGTLRLWRAGTRTEHRIIAGASAWPVLGLAFFAHEPVLGLLTGSGRFARIDARSGELLAQYTERDWVTQTALDSMWVGALGRTDGSAALSPSGARLAIGRLDGLVRLFDTATRTLVVDLAGHAGIVHGLAFSPDGRRLASCGSDGTIRLWAADAARSLASFPLVGSVPTSVAFLPDTGELLWGSEAGDVGILSTRNGRSGKAWSVSNDPVRALAVCPDGSRFACASRVGEVEIWHRGHAAKLVTLRIAEHGASVQTLAFSPAGERLAAGMEGGEVRIWETRVEDAARWAGAWNAAPLQLQAPFEALSAVGEVARRHAETLAEDLLQEHFDVETARSALLQQDLAPLMLDLAAEAVQKRGNLTSAELREIALQVVTTSDRSPSSYQRALRAAEAAYESDPEQPLGLAALGAAQLRIDQTEPALATLERALGAARSPADDEAAAFACIFRGLCLVALGRTVDAAPDLARARELASALDSERLRVCLIELETALAPRAQR